MANLPIIEAAWDLHAEFQKRRADRERLLAEAATAVRVGRFDAAERLYRDLLARQGPNADAWCGLGKLRVAQANWLEAFDAFLCAIEIDPSNGQAHHAVGVLFAQTAPVPGMVDRYHRAIDPTRTASRAGGSNAPVTDSLEAIEAVCADVVSRDPGHAAAFVRLGNVQLARLAIDRAIVSYQAARERAPGDPTVLQNLSVAFAARHDSVRSALMLGASHNARGEFTQAIAAYRLALAALSDVPPNEETAAWTEEAYVALGDCHYQLRQYNEALTGFTAGVRACPSSAWLYLKAVGVYHDLGRSEEARRLARRGVTACPDNVALRAAANLTLPVIYADAEERVRYRRRFTRGLAALARDVRLDTKHEQLRALEAIGADTNFDLAYQCEDDRSLQTQYGELVARIMAASYPQWARSRPMPPTGAGRIRIGYVSAFMRRHAVAASHLGWLRHADRSRFDIRAYHLGRQIDAVSDEFGRHAEVFNHLAGGLEAACARISDDDLHVLVYLDIGMFPRATQMAGLRLAPVQCTTWGHPVTSGLPTIDYFISSDLMEPPDGDAHYSERLVRLPNLGIAYSRPQPPQNVKPRASFGIGDDRVVFLCCQSPFKYLPEYDDVLTEIGRRVPGALFVFVGDHPAEPIFERRIKQAFGRAGLDGDRMCTILPSQSWPDYLSLMIASDVFLDTFGWSGCNTALEAMAMGLPVVTCPGTFMRGRHGYAFLTRLGVPEAIAKDRDEYVAIAVALAREPRRRAELVQKMRSRLDLLYDDREPVAALEDFYLQAVTRC